MTLAKPKPVRAPRNHHKRSGQHHKRSRNYIKAYWPYLPVFAVLGLGIVLNSFIGRQHHNVLGYATNISNRVLLAETNGERSSDHESALQLNTQLAAAAQAKANDMAKRNYWSHVTPDGQQPWSFIDAAGYQYAAAGENLAYGFGSSDEVITAWMHSAEHRANVLNANYQDVGFATANVANYRGTGPQTIVVAEYGQPLSAATTAPSSPNDTPIVLGTQTQTVSRVSLFSTASWIPLVLGVLCGATLMLFFIRHALAWHKVLVRGEYFVLTHPFFDIFLMSAAVLVFLLSRAAGTIL